MVHRVFGIVYLVPYFCKGCAGVFWWCGVSERSRLWGVFRVLRDSCGEPLPPGSAPQARGVCRRALEAVEGLAPEDRVFFRRALLPSLPGARAGGWRREGPRRLSRSRV